MNATIAGFIPSCTSGTRALRPTSANASLSTIRYRMLLLPSTMSRKDIRGWDAQRCARTPGLVRARRRARRWNARANASAEP